MKVYIVEDESHYEYSNVIGVYASFDSGWTVYVTPYEVGAEFVEASK